MSCRRVLLAGLLALPLVAPSRAPAQSFGIYRELWTNLPLAASNSLNVLTNTTLNPNWPTNPVAGFTMTFTNFETELNSGKTNYGQRLRAFVVPPTNGNYTFWIASDDASQLSLSSDENPSNTTIISLVTLACTNHQWSKQTSQQSAQIFMEGGRRYYTEALMQQSSNLDNLCIRWKIPTGAIEEPMTAAGTNGTIIIPCSGTNTTPGIYRQPSNATIVAGTRAVFNVIATNRSQLSYQWLQNGIVVTGATRSLYAVNGAMQSQSGAVFRCVLSNSAGAVTSAVATLVVQPPPAFGVYRELWTNLSATITNSLNALTNTLNNPNWPTNPAANFTTVFSNFETEVSSVNTNYGQRLRAFVVPPANGPYTLYIASDDSSKLFLSTDENPSNASAVSSVNTNTSPHQWNSETNQKSAAIWMETGRRYYIEAQMQQGLGNDNLCVKWAIPNSTSEEPLTANSLQGTVLIPCNGIVAPPGIWRQPSSATAVEGATPAFTVVATNGSQLTYQWMLNGTNISGATKSVCVASNVLPALSGSGFSCLLSNSAGVATSAVATITVQPAPTFGIFRELWSNLNTTAGNSLAMLTNTTSNPNWPACPTVAFTKYFTNFEAEINSGKNYYGQRMRAFVIPPANGNYTFWIASDDSSGLFLSADESPTNKSLICYVAPNQSTGSETYTTYTNQMSSQVYLEGGRRYYIEAQMQQGLGNDNLSVRWQLPSGEYEQPMTSTSGVGTLLIPYNGIDLPPGLCRQPTNITVYDRFNASFSVVSSNRSPVTYQWTCNGTNIAGAVKPSYVVSNATVGISGQIYICVISNPAGVTTSALATLTVIYDTTPPTVVNAFNLGPTNVQINYSEPVEPSSATNTANYVFSNGVAVTGAMLSPDNTSVTLAAGPLVYGSNYWVVVNNVRDQATTPNILATNTLVKFTATPYLSLDIGNSTITSVVTIVSNGVDILAAGSGIGDGPSDQFNFNSLARTGDFDVSLRLANLGLSDVFAKAGLMAREKLTVGSRFAASFATPSMAGDFFEWRDPAGIASSKTGNFPANFPNSWLRLKRAGNVFSGYASYDGLAWTQLGGATIVMTNPVYVGLILTSRSTNQAILAQFRDITEMTGNVVIATSVSPRDLIGPTSRKTPIVFSEMMYKPAPRADSNNVEFVEIYNSNPWFHNIGGYSIVGSSMAYTFPSGTVIAGGAYLCIGASPQGIANVYGATNIMGPYTGSLKKSDTLSLYDEVGALLLSISYSDLLPWPVAAGGIGHSLILTNPTYGENDPRAWDISSQMGGTPGTINTYVPDPLDGVVINEFLAHTDLPMQDAIELYNHSNAPKNLSGAWLSEDSTTNKFQIPPGTIIPARGFVYFQDGQLGFRLNKTGDKIFLWNSNQTRVVDAVNFEPQENSVSMGRVPDGSGDFYRLASLSLGTNNGPQRLSPIVINELMYKPISGNDDDQYVELFNRASSNIDLSGWNFSSGIMFSFPSNTVMSPGGYLVIARSAAHLRTNYPNLDLSNCLGDFGGKLSHGGERVALAFPHTSIVITNGLTNSSTMYISVSEVTYNTGGRWGLWAAGGGSSLELIDPNADTRLPSSWADSDETAKAAWTNIEFTGVLDNGANYGSSISNAQLGILDVGECLVDDVEIYSGTNMQNLVINPSFEGGATNWFLEGDHVRSSLENIGYNGSSRSLHMRASSRVWTGANCCEFYLQSNTMASGQTATMRYKARWLRGWPEIYLRLNGNWLEATGPMPVPSNLGTPGLPNSRYITNAPPAIYSVSHWPTVPSTGQSVVVSCRVSDPDGVASLAMNYRIDPATNYTSVVMKDDGTGGDVIAGDGIFSATFPGQASNKVIAFTILATDSRGATNRFPEIRNINEPDRECVVYFGDGNPTGSFGIYHLWLTQAMINRWNSLPDLSNESHDCTMVNGNRVIYNMQARYAGSPYHQNFNGPNGTSLCHYKWTFNDDDKFLGLTSFNKIHQPGNSAGDDPTIQREQLAHTFMRALGVPWLNRRYVVVYVNGNRRSTLMEDAQTPDSDIVDERWPNDADGWLYKMQPWFEFPPAFTDNAANQNKSFCLLGNYTTTGGEKKKARYRWNYMIRSSPYSANDFTNIYALIDAANSPSNTLSANMKNIADMENWMRIFAANHAAGNWDSFGCNNAQNLYGYIGQKGTKYSLIMWDYNIVIGLSSTWTPPAPYLFTYDSGSDVAMDHLYRNPEFRRMYWRALQELVNGPLDASQYGPFLDTRFTTFTANGISVENPNTFLKGWMFTAQTGIAAQVSGANATNFTISPTITYSNNIAFISGSAPFNVKTVWFNGAEWPITWTSITGWTARVVAPPGTNSFSVAGVDIHGNQIAGDTGVVSVVYTGYSPSLTGQVVISEIMYNPTAGPQYLELFNTSTNMAFDLSGWKFNGASYTFPAASMLAPSSFLTLATDSRAYSALYGGTNIVFDIFTGTLDSNGETLSLLAYLGNQTSVVDRVRYEAGVPWPVITNGAALQLIDPTNDNSRVSNWGIGISNVPFSRQWVYVASTGTVSGTNLLIYLQSNGSNYVDDVHLVVSNQDVGTSIVSNGGFETAFNPWTSTTYYTSSAITTNFKHSGTSALSIVSSSGGDSSLNVGQSILPAPPSGAVCTMSYWYLQSTSSAPNIVVLLQGGGVSNMSVPYVPPLTNTALETPGRSNSISSRLPAYPALWLNEVEVDNITGPTDNIGDHDPWVEICNTDTNPISLAGLFLADNYTNLLEWAFPTNAMVPSNAFVVVWCDAQTNQATTNMLHTNFRLPSGNGRIALSRMVGAATQIVDYLTYTNLPSNWSYGDVPDGQPFYRQKMFNVSPGAPNNSVAAPLNVFINEWMAENTNTLVDPADSKCEDWFEIYNPDTNSVDLGGYYLTDTLSDPLQFMIPANGHYLVPPGDYLLVWADGKNSKNSTNDLSLHVNFKLAKEGEAIGLFAVNGTAIDAITFGAQTADTSQGRYPDGTANIFFMPPTPLAANNIFNTAPIVAAISNKYAYLGQTLRFVATATDNEGQFQTLVFSLDPGAPAGASINGATGEFSWPVTNAAVVGTNSITVRATDNGTPPMSGTNAFAVIVLSPAAYTCVSVPAAGAIVQLMFVTAQGMTYQLEYKDALDDPGGWQPLGDPVAGDGSTVVIADNLSSSLQRFYRLCILP